jgi:hypothetical protein
MCHALMNIVLRDKIHLHHILDVLNVSFVDLQITLFLFHILSRERLK